MEVLLSRKILPRTVVLLAVLLGVLLGLIGGVVSGWSTSFNGYSDEEMAAGRRASILFFGVSAVSVGGGLGVSLGLLASRKVAAAASILAAAGILILEIKALNVHPQTGIDARLIIISLPPVALFSLGGLRLWRASFISV